MERSPSWKASSYTLKRFSTFYRTWISIIVFTRPYQLFVSRASPVSCVIFHNMLVTYSEVLLACFPAPKLEDQPLLAVLYCLISTYVSAIRICRFVGCHWRSKPEDTPCCSSEFMTLCIVTVNCSVKWFIVTGLWCPGSPGFWRDNPAWSRLQPGWED
jgi:hypothetical protein